MTRHGKNCTAGAVYTYHERQQDSKRSGWGSKKARLTKDAIKDFDCCSLMLQPCKDPVVSREGHLYDREAILEYILHHKQAYAKKLKAYEKQLEKEKRNSEKEANIGKKEQVEKFLSLEKSIATKRENPFSTNGDGGPSKKKATEDSIKNTSEENKKSLPSFWIPTLTPEADTNRIEKPDPTVYCPMSGKPLRMKELISVKFTLAPDDEGGKALVARKERFVCAVTRDVLNNSTPCAVLKSTGDVLSLNYINEFVKKDWTCPISGKKLKEKDIIELKRGGTGYAAVSGEELEGKLYGASLTCG